MMSGCIRYKVYESRLNGMKKFHERNLLTKPEDIFQTHLVTNYPCKHNFTNPNLCRWMLVILNDKDIFRVISVVIQ